MIGLGLVGRWDPGYESLMLWSLTLFCIISEGTNRPWMGHLWPTCVCFVLLMQTFSVISCYDLKIKCFHLKMWIYINVTVQKFLDE